jgi:hypothetical protein
MPLALQALLPFAALLGAAAIVRLRPRARGNGWIASIATFAAGLITLIELLRLAPGERVDAPYLTTFPYADLAIRLDGLSLAFATVTLITAALLMLARLPVRGDRRDPWFSWLLTSAAACAVIFANNLLLVYVALQVLTLAWSGAVDETAPRRRTLRLTVQITDIGLLLAAAGAIQSVGTSAFTGVPSDTFGLAAFLLVLAPVVARIFAIAWVSGASQTAVAFEPAIAWVAPAGYLLLRLLSLMGGRLPDRTTAVVLFGGAAIAAAVLAALALWDRLALPAAGLLLAAQAALALAFSAGNDPLFTVASTWLWLLLVPLAGLASVRVVAGSTAQFLTLVNLAMIPATTAFLGLWLGRAALDALGLPVGLIPVGLALALSVAAALSRVSSPRRAALDLPTAWGGALLLVGAFPFVVMAPIVIAAAATVRSVPAGTVVTGPLGVSTANGRWPALAVSVVVAAVVALAAWWAGRRLPLRPRRAPRAARVRWPVLPLRRPTLPGWSQLVLWGIFVVIAGVAFARP